MRARDRTDSAESQSHILACFSFHMRGVARAALIVLSITLVACGGGGGSGGGDSGEDTDSGDDGSGDDGSGDDGSGDGGSGDGDTTATTFELSGTALIPDNVQADSDTNEPSTPTTDNGRFSSAQPIRNPVTLGGYVNRPGTGDSGDSFVSGDVSDIYRVNLAADQRITLAIADPVEEGARDLDLYLYPDGCSDRSCGSNGCDFSSAEGVADQSITLLDTESVTVDEGGDYFVEVCAFEGASNYRLSTSQSESLASSGVGDTDGPSMADDFVPGDIVVRFADKEPKTGATVNSADRAAALGMSHAAGAAKTGPVLMRMGDRVTTLDALGVRAGDHRKRAVYAAQGERPLAKWDTLRAIAALEARSDIAWAEPNYNVQPSATPNDGLFNLQWHYPQINLQQAWDTTTGTDDKAIVAVIDTGIRAEHPDFTGQNTGTGFDFISDPTRADDGDGIDDDPTDEGDGGGSQPDSWHGTHVAGTVAARTDDGNNGVAGVAWDAARLMHLRALGVGGGTSFDIAQAIRYAAGLDTDAPSPPPEPADVINMSLGSPTAAEVTREAVSAAAAEGVSMVAAAGNANTDVPSFPAAFDDVISVSAVDINAEKASYSNFGPTIDVAAPGGDRTGDVDGDGNPDLVLSTFWDSNNNAPSFSYSAGTSMAAPHVAGVLALMHSVEPGLTPLQVDNLLTSGDLTDDIGATGRDDLFGHGLINAAKAVTAAAEGVSSTPVIATTPGSLNFGISASEIKLRVANGGSGSLVDVSATANREWLTVEAAASVDAEGLGEYRVSVDRSGLTDGTFTGSVTFSSSDPDVDDETVSVVMQVASADPEANASRHFFLLLDPDDFTTVAQAVADAEGGRYSFVFSGIEEGEYRLIAGTDLDNDGFICDAGEACGAFETLDSPATFTVDSDRGELDFDTGFNSGFRSSRVDNEATELPVEGFRRLRPKRLTGER